MYVCICKAVTDRQIREAAHDGARTLRDLRERLEVATQCGRCAPCARECLDEALAMRPPTPVEIPVHALFDPCPVPAG